MTDKASPWLISELSKLLNQAIYETQQLQDDEQ